MTKKIIVNDVFVGGYGKEGNLPHEVINFYQEDNGGFYVYLTPWGQMNFQKDEVEGILFVRTAGDGFVEILGKAQGIEEIYVKGLKVDRKKRVAKGIPQPHAAIIQNIRYGGKTLEEIHANNKTGIKVYVSCKVEKLFLPTETLFIAVCDKDKWETDLRKDVSFWMPPEAGECLPKKINNQSMKVIYDEKERENQYKKLKEILDDKELWTADKKEVEVPKYNANNIKDDDSVFKVLRLQDDEVSFSNMLFYYFSTYKTVLQKFINDVLKLKIILGSDYVVEREKNRMDISIRAANKFYIILENKIKSDINGKKAKSHNKKIESQLSKYYDIGLKDMGGDDEKVHCFLLRPEYMEKIDSSIKNIYFRGDKYKPVSYSKIYEFFTNERKTNIYKDKYLDDFCKALFKHTEKTDNEFKNDMLKRLKQRIENI